MKLAQHDPTDKDGPPDVAWYEAADDAKGTTFFTPTYPYFEASRRLFCHSGISAEVACLL